MTKKLPMSESPRYREFVSDRDRALETLHQKTQLKITDVLRGTLERALRAVDSIYGRFDEQGFPVFGVRQMLDQANHVIEHEFNFALAEIFHLVMRLRRSSYTFAYASEVEAMSRALGKSLTGKLTRHQVDQRILDDSPAGGKMADRIKLYLDRIRRDMIDKLQMSAVVNSPLDDTMLRVYHEFPQARIIRVPKKILKAPLREAAGDDEDSVGFFNPGAGLFSGPIDPEAWSEALEDYYTEFIPKWRGPDSVIGVFKSKTEMKNEWYAWELERDLTEDFVNQVRMGQVQAAKDNKINDFVWIAIIDQKTDDCCSWRNALTSAEIERELKGKHKDDECQAVVPPAHFNCRCTLAPMTDDMPDSPPSNAGEFESWLKS